MVDDTIMPKRKRETSDAVEVDNHKKAQPSIRQLRAEQKVDHGQKVLTRAFKAACGPERQKLGRRQKTAASTKNDSDLKRINAEVAALKVSRPPAVILKPLEPPC